MTDVASLSDLPGFELVAPGLRDLADGRHTAEALLVLIGAARLRAAGVDVPAAEVDDPEERLWELLERDGADTAHGRYNALIRRLVSFERAAECASR